MTPKVEQLLKAGAANMANSLGQMASNAPRPTILPATMPAGPDRYAGRTKGQGGEMLLANLVPDPDQPRKEFDPVELSQLAESLKTHGQLQPIRVRWSAEIGKWIIVAGERRYRAAHEAGLTKLACVFVENEQLTSDVLLEEQLVENAIRADLKPIEQAKAYRRLMDLKGYNGREVAERLHLHPTTVTRALQLLELPEPVRAKVEDGSIAPSIGAEIAKLSSTADQVTVAEEITAGKLSRAKAVVAVAAKRKPKKAGKGKGTSADPLRSNAKTTYVFQEPHYKVQVDFPKPLPVEEVRYVLVDLLAALQLKLNNAA